MATDDAKPTALLHLRDERERVIARLSDAFARDVLSLEDFEERLGLAHRATTTAELVPLEGDLGDVVPAAQPVPTTALVPASEVRDHRTLVAIMGGVSRSGGWVPARHTKIYTCMGGVELDFREAMMPPGVTEVTVYAVWGGVSIIVPPQLAVEIEGIAIMGGFDHTLRAPPQLDPDRPRLRIGGVVVMGGVQIETRLFGESEWDARRRRRHEKKALRKAARQGLLPPKSTGQ
jgi:hypothetical protein